MPEEQESFTEADQPSGPETTAEPGDPTGAATAAGTQGVSESGDTAAFESADGSDHTAEPDVSVSGVTDDTASFMSQEASEEAAARWTFEEELLLANLPVTGSAIHAAAVSRSASVNAV